MSNGKNPDFGKFIKPLPDDGTAGIDWSTNDKANPFPDVDQNTPAPNYDYFAAMLTDPEAFRELFGFYPDEIKKKHYRTRLIEDWRKLSEPQVAPFGAKEPFEPQGGKSEKIIYEILLRLNNDKKNIKKTPLKDLKLILEKLGPDLLRSATETRAARVLDDGQKDDVIPNLEELLRGELPEPEIFSLLLGKIDPEDERLRLDRYHLPNETKRYLMHESKNKFPPKDTRYEKIKPDKIFNESPYDNGSAAETFFNSKEGYIPEIISMLKREEERRGALVAAILKKMREKGENIKK